MGYMTENKKEMKRSRINWSIRGVLPLLVGVAALVILVVAVVGIVGKRMRLDASVMATRVEVVQRLKGGWGRKGGGRSAYVYVPNYYYEVDGKEYTCMGADEKTFDDVSMELQEIYYVQSNPAECVVSSQMEVKLELWQLLVVIMMGIMMVLIGIYGIVEGVSTLRGNGGTGTDFITPLVQ